MKITNQVHAGTAIAAAVLAILAIFGISGSSVFTIITMFRYSTAAIGSYLAGIAGNILGVIFVIVALLRRKKDNAAGVFFIIALLITAMSLFGNIRTVFGGYGSSQTIAAVIRILGIMVCIVFYALLSVECFSPGAISGASVKILPMILPVLYIILLLAATVFPLIPEVLSGADPQLLLFSGLIPAVITFLSKLWMVILGLAFSTAVYEKPSFEYFYSM